MKSRGYMDDVLTPEAASISDVERVHTSEFIEYLKTKGEGPLDPDTMMHPETFEIALLAVGGTVLAVEKAVKDRKGHIALVRPPGHHAGPTYPGGFCYLNNIAVAAHKLLDTLKRVAILDFDAHHGNGTSEIFHEEPRVLYISTHHYGIFPGTGAADDAGEGNGEGFNVNIPFTGGCGDSSFSLAMQEIIKPIVEQYKPEAILVSFGGDAHYTDPLTGLALSSQGYVDLMDATDKLAKDTCGERIAIALEGGYNQAALSETLLATEAIFRGESSSVKLNENRDPDCAGKKIVQRVKEIQGRYWKL